MTYERPLEATFRNELIHLDGVTRMSPGRRGTILYAEQAPADSLYFLDSGLVKIFRRRDGVRDLILRLATPGELFGEEAAGPRPVRETASEILSDGIMFSLPRASFLDFCDANPKMWRLFSQVLLRQKQELQDHLEMLSLQDVECRILTSLAELAEKLRVSDSPEPGIPLSQGELASLIGATRETTSTTLNAVARRGLVTLGRRMLLVPSVEKIRAAAAEHASRIAPKPKSLSASV